LWIRNQTCDLDAQIGLDDVTAAQKTDKVLRTQNSTMRDKLQTSFWIFLPDAVLESTKWTHRMGAPKATYKYLKKIREIGRTDRTYFGRVSDAQQIGRSA
jgi:hypothetical protein